MHTFKYALRRLARTPGFTLATIFTLALGIGANTAVFSILNGVLFKPLPFPEPDRLAAVWLTAPGVKITDLNLSRADFLTQRAENRVFEDLGLWNPGAAIVTGLGDPERVECLYVTAGTLSIAGAHPALGRTFDRKDEAPGVKTAMLSHGYWQRRFHSDRGVVGRTIIADGEAREIIGVLPQNFWFLDAGHDLALPIEINPPEINLGGYNFGAIARLRPGVTYEQVNADIARMAGITSRTFQPFKGFSLKMFEDARIGPNARPLSQDVTGDLGKTLWLVMGAICIVLLIACANVANLLLVRAEGRSRELSVRAALGAGWARIASELLAESLTLSVLGGAVGSLLAFGLLRLVLSLAPFQLPRSGQIAIDPASLAFAFFLAVAAGLSLGIIPVFKYGGVRLGESLRAGGRTSSNSRECNAARNGLTAFQAGLALVLLIGAGLMLRGFQSLRRVDPGFTHPETLQTLRVSIPAGSGSGVALWRIHNNILNRLRSIPGVESAAMASGLPMTGANGQDPIFAEDRPRDGQTIPPLRRFFTAGPGYFHSIGTPITAGRDFTMDDLEQVRPVILISENFAREYWGSAGAAVGRRVRTTPAAPWLEIVGVVADIRQDGCDKKAPTIVYWPPVTRDPRGEAVATSAPRFAIRSARAGGESFVREVRQAVLAANPNLVITRMETMKDAYDKSMARTSFILVLLGISGAMALLLAGVGVYAVISYAVTQRTREIGIRMALGAQPGELKRMFVRNGVLWVSVGAGVGMAAAIGLTRFMASVLYEVNPADPLTYSLVAMGLIATGAAASYLPARRVTKVDPATALRAE